MYEEIVSFITEVQNYKKDVEIPDSAHYLEILAEFKGRYCGKELIGILRSLCSQKRIKYAGIDVNQNPMFKANDTSKQ